MSRLSSKSPSTSEFSSTWSLFRSSSNSQKAEPQQQRTSAPLTVGLALSLEAALVELATKHLKAEGLFRVGASIDEIRQLTEDITAGRADTHRFHDLDEHVIANAVKRALHQHEPLLPAHLYQAFIAASPDYVTLIEVLPDLNKRILSSLFAFFAMVVEDSPSNRMDADAIARSIGEMLLRPPEDEDMSDLETVQQRLKATRTVFHYLLDNRTTILPPADEFGGHIAGDSYDEETQSLANSAAYEMQGRDNLFDEGGWEEIASSHVPTTAKQRVSPVVDMTNQPRDVAVDTLSVDDLPDDTVSEIDELPGLLPSQPGIEGDLDPENEISHITEAASEVGVNDESPEIPPPIAVRPRAVDKEQNKAHPAVPLSILVAEPPQMPSATNVRQSDHNVLNESQESATPGPALTRAHSPEINRASFCLEDFNSHQQHDRPSAELRLPDRSAVCSSAAVPILKQAKSTDKTPTLQSEHLVESKQALETPTPAESSKLSSSQSRFSSAVLAVRASQKFRKTHDGLGFSENFKPRPKTEFGEHAGVLIEGWLHKKQTSSPGLWNRRYVVLYDDMNIRFYGKARKSAWGMLPLDVRNRIPLALVSRVISDARANNGRQFDIICEWSGDKGDAHALFNGTGWERHKEREKGERKQTNTASKVFHLRAATSEERLLWVTVLEQSLKQVNAVSTLRTSMNRPPLPPKAYSMGAYLTDRENDAKSDNNSVCSDTELHSTSKSESRQKVHRGFNFPFGGKRATDSGDELGDDQRSVGSAESSKSKGWRTVLSFREQISDRGSH